MNRPLVLASASPRRKELLQTAGYDFRVIVADDSAETSVPLDLPPNEYVSQAALRKAENVVAKMESDAVVVSADTIAVLNEQIIGKPVDRNHAHEILMKLSGTIHLVLTGVTVWDMSSGKHLTHVESTELSMMKLSDDQLKEYLDSNQWEGKAGAFGYQDGLDWVRIERGLESNVVGLPIERLPDLIEQVIGI